MSHLKTPRGNQGAGQTGVTPPRSGPTLTRVENRLSVQREPKRIYCIDPAVYTPFVTKRLIDVDDNALEAARAQLGTRTIKDTVNEALRHAAHQRKTQLASALSVLAHADLDDRSTAWR